MSEQTPKFSDTYVIKTPGSVNLLLSTYRLYYEDALTVAAKLGGIVTNFSYASRNILGFDYDRLTPYPRE